MPASSELRHDRLTGRSTIVAAGRAARPRTVAHDRATTAAGADECPFCDGHEAMTPPEVCRAGSGAPDGPGWRVRVVPNLYPIVDSASATGEPEPGALRGAHEVVVLSPSHDRSFGRLDDAAAIEVVRVLRDRVAAHVADGCPYAVAFVNHGRAAGASIAHPHGQVVALGLVPPEARAADERAREAGLDLLADDLATARQHALVVDDDGDVSTWFPHAGPAPFVVRVAHRASGARFEATPDDVLDAVALAVRDALARLDDVLDDPPYNVTVHGAAADGTGPRRWYVEITPRVSVVAGFELATGILVNTVPPERAAAIARDGWA